VTIATLDYCAVIKIIAKEIARERERERERENKN
jgi:hypothetical protein